ncbi:MAG: peroxiredoxin [Candidatus Dadabacteria bacterium]|nr:peroxiredoxin [Candidatus Dadabacteria bacterium]MXZ48813.1 peroxiredoxin [Candidatus Dadabacteria bacterium]MYB25992.1 peroxiredoxin [Candidatus Dadabacteria bacterium]MYE61480.1 peroxiredoxin [Candidatus Dadabacteria bacterium]MYI73213.1 peroxiredoxin [Candidatus Dadabacteria bacterium]
MGRNLEVGSQAPDFETETYGAEKVRLSDFYSKGTVVLYFYPRDNSTGCIWEACSLRNAERELASLGVQVLGVSTDGVKSHEKFRDKFSLNFPLLSDKRRKIVDLYGARWRLIPFVARRTTFLIEKGGRIAYIWHKVKPSSHAEEILIKVKELGL